MSAAALSVSEAWQHVLAVLACRGAVPIEGNLPPQERSAEVYRSRGLAVAANGRWQYEGPVDAEAAQLLDIMLALVAGRTPLVVAQFGQSLDGRIATDNGDSCHVTGTAGLVHLHALRAVVDAVLVGATTVACDNPRLSVRHVEGRNPVRVVLDPRGRVPLERFVFDDDGAETLHLVAQPLCADWQREHDARGRRVRVLGLEMGEEGALPAQVIRLLKAQGLSRLLIEGGGVTISRFLQHGCLDRLHCMVTPMLIGSGRPTLTLPTIARLDRALRPPARHFTLGADVLFDLDLAGADGSGE